MKARKQHLLYDPTEVAILLSTVYKAKKIGENERVISLLGTQNWG